MAFVAGRPGLPTWTPSGPDPSSVTVQVQVSDEHASVVRQQFSLAVVQRAYPPQITSVPVGPAWAGQLWQYPLSITDLDVGDTFSYQVTGLPGYALVGDQNKTLQWPADSQPTSRSVEIRVTDSHGNVGIETFTLPVERLNQSPRFTSVAKGPASYQQAWQYPAAATDADNDTLTYALDADSLARGLQIVPSSGLATWAGPGPIGSYEVTVIVTDGHNGEADVTLIARDTVDGGELKVGNFKMSFTDLSIPVSGIPITITRTYDSLNAGRQGDFGYGWQMEMSNARVRQIAWRVVRRIFGPHRSADWDDACQVVVIHLFDKLRVWRGADERSFRSFAYVVASREAIGLARRRLPPTVNLENEGGLADRAIPPDPGVRECIKSQVGRFNPKWQLAFRSRREGDTYEEIARRFDRTVHAVQIWFHAMYRRPRRFPGKSSRSAMPYAPASTRRSVFAGARSRTRPCTASRAGR